jgi:hypothetical protein
MYKLAMDVHPASRGGAGNGSTLIPYRKIDNSVALLPTDSHNSGSVRGAVAVSAVCVHPRERGGGACWAGSDRWCRNRRNPSQQNPKLVNRTCSVSSHAACNGWLETSSLGLWSTRCGNTRKLHSRAFTARNSVSALKRVNTTGALASGKRDCERERCGIGRVHPVAVIPVHRHMPTRAHGRTRTCARDARRIR